MDIVDELRSVTEKLAADGVDYALCGGLAMAVYAMPRATFDIEQLRGSGTDQDDIAYLSGHHR